MAADSQPGRAQRPAVLPGLEVSDEPLSPEQAESIVRQRLAQLSPQWSLSGAEMRLLSARLIRKPFERGQLILPHRVRAGCLGLVVSGRVAVWRAGPPVSQLDAVLGPGDIFGQTMLVAGEPNAATLQAATPCEVWFVRRTDLDAVVAGRQTRQWRTWALRLAPWLAACLLAMVGVALPPVREASALGPMAIGQWCRQQQQAGCAERAWGLAARLAPMDVSPYLALGMLYYERGDVASAERVLNAALILAPDSPEAYNNLGLLYAGQGEYERAITAFEQALALEPGSAAVEHNLAYSLQAMGSTDDALAHYRQAVALGDREASTQANMAIAYLEAGQLTEAAAAAQQALAYDNTLAPAQAVLGAAILGANDAAGAIPYLQRAIALDPEYCPAYFYLALAHKALGQNEEALVAFQLALNTAYDEEMRVRIQRHMAGLDSGSE